MKREDLFAIDTRSKRHKVNVPAWGGDLAIRVLTAGERDDIERSIDPNDTTNPDFFYALVIKCVVDPETGEQTFLPDDTEKLRELPAPGMVAVGRECMRVNGIGEFSESENP